MLKQIIGRFNNNRAYKKEEKALTKDLAAAIYHALGFTQSGSRIVDDRLALNSGRTVMEICDLHAQTIRTNSIANDAEFGSVTVIPFYTYPFRSMNLSEKPFSEQQREVVLEIDKQYQPKFKALHNKYFGK